MVKGSIELIIDSFPTEFTLENKITVVTSMETFVIIAIIMVS